MKVYKADLARIPAKAEDLRVPAQCDAMTALAPSNTTSPPTCFTDYRPPFHTNDTTVVASAYFSAVFSVVGLSSNLFAFVVLMKTYQRSRSSSRSSFLIFLSGLVVTDFMGLLVTGSIVVSFRITKFNWGKLDPNCHFCNFMGMSMVFYGLCPLLLGAAMAMERFVGINRPFARSTRMSKGRVLSTLLMVWVAAGVIGLLPAMGLSSYRLQSPGSWCFFSVSSQPLDLTFCLIFSLLGLLSLAVSFVLNTVSVVTLFRVCCGQAATMRRRDHEVEMMVQLICIMIIATICWCPLLVFIARTVLSNGQLKIEYLLLGIRFATLNQILDPWVYILFRRSILKRIYPRADWSRDSIMTMHPNFLVSVRKLTRSSLGGGLDEAPKHRPSESTNESATPVHLLSS